MSLSKRGRSKINGVQMVRVRDVSLSGAVSEVDITRHVGDCGGVEHQEESLEKRWYYQEPRLSVHYLHRQEEVDPGPGSRVEGKHPGPGGSRLMGS